MFLGCSTGPVSDDARPNERGASRIASAQTTGTVELLAELEEGHNIVSFYEGLDPDGPALVMTETGEIGEPSVVPPDVEAHGPAAVWDYLRPGEPPPSALSDAIARAASRPRDPDVELALEVDARAAYEAEYPNATEEGLNGGEDYLARTQYEVQWFEQFVAESAMYPSTSSPNHFGGMTTQWNGTTWWEHGAWERMDALTAFGSELDGASGFHSVWWWKQFPGGWGWEVLFNTTVLPNHWHRIMGTSNRKLFWRSDAKNESGALLGLALFGRNKEFYNPPPPPPPVCAYSAVVETGECYDLWGNRSWLSDYPLTQSGCGSTEEAAISNAKFAIRTQRCIHDDPLAGCCLFTLDTYSDVCLCQ